VVVEIIHQIFLGNWCVSLACKNHSLVTYVTVFLSHLSSSLTRLGKGFHVGDWGQIKEWKPPDAEGLEFMNDTHRHLSELVGWYPGYSNSSFSNGHSNITIQNVVRQKLYSRGEGKAEDANAGWAKVWRSACWARLNETERAYFELRYAIGESV
jgi:alpha-L-fucosidase 2